MRDEDTASLRAIIDHAIREQLVEQTEALLDAYESDQWHYLFPERKYVDIVRIAEKIIDSKEFTDTLEHLVSQEVNKRFDAVLSERVEARIEKRNEQEHEKIHMPTWTPNN